MRIYRAGAGLGAPFSVNFVQADGIAWCATQCYLRFCAPHEFSPGIICCNR
jgi:hypothetical protein